MVVPSTGRSFTLLMGSESLLWQPLSSFLPKGTSLLILACTLRQAGKVPDAKTGATLTSLRLPVPQAWTGTPTEPDVLRTICTKAFGLRVASSHHVNFLRLEGEKTVTEFSLIFLCLLTGGMSCWCKTDWPEYLIKMRKRLFLDIFIK